MRSWTQSMGGKEGKTLAHIRAASDGFCLNCVQSTHLYFSQSTSNLFYSIAEDICITYSHWSNSNPFTLQFEGNTALLSAVTVSRTEVSQLGQSSQQLVHLKYRSVQTSQQPEHCKLVHKGCKLSFEILFLGAKFKATVSHFRSQKCLNAYSLPLFIL